ncbi:MAG: hypothetical protein K0U60_07825, partial [Actinomycetia bacterium]|nr:hypothetical protein [Actinomycetes bacterium]
RHRTLTGVLPVSRMAREATVIRDLPPEALPAAKAAEADRVARVGAMVRTADLGEAGLEEAVWSVRRQEESG